jgi:AcrR family transcriptional regulator
MQREQKIAGNCSLSKTSSPRLCMADRLSHTARRLFYRRGIRAVGVEEIAAEAGVTKPSLYRSFSSKDALVVSCLQDRFDRIMAWWDDLEDRLPGDSLAQLRTLIAEVADETSSPFHRGCVVTNAAVEFPEPGHPARLIAESYKRVMRERLLTLIQRLPVDQPALLTDGLALLFEGARATRHTSGNEGPAASMKATADALLGAFLRPETAA